MLKPVLRLTWRLAPYMYFTFLSVLAAIFIILGLIINFHHTTLLYLPSMLGAIALGLWIGRHFGENAISAELHDRAGKPIKVFRPGKKNYRFLKTSKWNYEIQSCYLVLVNPRTSKYSFVKYLYLLDPSSEDFSNQLLEVAATNEKAFEEISSKVQSGKWRASSDLRKFEGATAISEAISDIMK